MASTSRSDMDALQSLCIAASPIYAESKSLDIQLNISTPNTSTITKINDSLPSNPIADASVVGTNTGNQSSISTATSGINYIDSSATNPENNNLNRNSINNSSSVNPLSRLNESLNQKIKSTVDTTIRFKYKLEYELIDNIPDEEKCQICAGLAVHPVFDLDCADRNHKLNIYCKECVISQSAVSCPTCSSKLEKPYAVPLLGYYYLNKKVRCTRCRNSVCLADQNLTGLIEHSLNQCKYECVFQCGSLKTIKEWNSHHTECANSRAQCPFAHWIKENKMTNIPYSCEWTGSRLILANHLKESGCEKLYNLSLYCLNKGKDLASTNRVHQASAVIPPNERYRNAILPHNLPSPTSNRIDLGTVNYDRSNNTNEQIPLACESTAQNNFLFTLDYINQTIYTIRIAQINGIRSLRFTDFIAPLHLTRSSLDKSIQLIDDQYKITNCHIPSLSRTCASMPGLNIVLNGIMQFIERYQSANTNWAHYKDWITQLLLPSLGLNYSPNPQSIINLQATVSNKRKPSAANSQSTKRMHIPNPGSSSAMSIPVHRNPVDAIDAYVRHTIKMIYNDIQTRSQLIGQTREFVQQYIYRLLNESQAAVWNQLKQSDSKLFERKFIKGLSSTKYQIDPTAGLCRFR